MNATKQVQRTFSVNAVVAGTIENAICEFYTERSSRGTSHYTIEFYQKKLKVFTDWLQGQGVIYVEEITSDTIRHFLLSLKGTHTQGGLHAFFRSIRVFLRWYWDEYDPQARNPIAKVRCAMGIPEAKKGVTGEDVKLMLAACDTERDRAIISILADTGIRRREMIDLKLADINIEEQNLTIVRGKNGKARQAYLGQQTKRTVRKYLASREGENENAPLWLGKNGVPLTVDGLRQVVRRRAELAGLKPPGLHDFRRYCAITLLRNGVDLLTVSRLLGHCGVTVTMRYLRQEDEELQKAFNKASPVDTMKRGGLR